MLLRLASALLLLSTIAAPQTPTTLTVDFAHPLGPWQPVTAAFGYDELNETTTPSGRALLSELASAFHPVPVLIRAHHLFTSGDGQPLLKWSSSNVLTLDAHGQPVYNFTLLDQTFDAWVESGTRPFIELGFMPEALASQPGPYHLAYPHTIEGSVQSPPKDFRAWQALCRALTEHLVQRYGRKQVAQWPFEVWNEPDIRYWHGTRAQYFQLYDYAVAGVRSALPEAIVGGPATTSPRSPKAAGFLQAFLNHVAHDRSSATGQKIPLDFISFHAKGKPQLATGDSNRVRMGLAPELTDADHGFALIASFPQFRDLPIYLTEADPEGCAACSVAENPGDAYRLSPLYAAYTAQALSGFLTLAARHHVHLAAMITWAFEFNNHPPFEGLRTLTTGGIDLPILNFFRETALLHGQRVQATSSAALPIDAILSNGVPTPNTDVLATHSPHQAAVLFWSYQDEDLPNAPATPTTLSLTGLPPNAHHLTAHLYRVDLTHGNALPLWQQMGSPVTPTPAQLQQLIAAGRSSMDQPETLHLTATHGNASLPLTLPPQAVWALTIDLP